MSPVAIWLYAVLLVGSAIATDVPFVFDETSADVASYTSAQLEQARTSSPELAGVPSISSPSDSEILAFPVTGGGSTPEGATDKKVGELKESLSARVEPDNSVVRHEAVVLAAKYPGDRTIDQISSIYSYLKNGADSKKGWSYVADTRGIDNFMYANETLEIGKDAGCVGAGDCDDFAILMSALIESIGGTTRIILARNNTTGGHAYTEVYLGNLDAQNNQVEGIINWLKEKFDTVRIYTHIDTDTKNVWLNLDWGPDEKGNTHPGGPFYQGDKHIVLSIRDTFVKTPLKLPEKSNKPPKLIRLTSDKPSPQDAGTIITWTAEAKDADKDPVLYHFFLNDDPVTKWAKENRWIWNTTKDDLGENKIEIQVRDGKHAGPDNGDASNVTKFTIATLPPKSQEQSNQPPSLISFTSDRPSPQDAGASITWTAEAKDPENDQVLYRLLLNSKPQGVWTSHNTWTWDVAETEVGDNQIEVWVRDGKHSGKEGFDDRKSLSFVITASDQKAAIGQTDSIDPSKWTENGNALFKAGSYEDALKCYEKAIQHSPLYADAWYGKANALCTQGKYEECIACLDKCINIDPTNLAALNNKGAALFELGRYDEALACYDQSIKEDPSFATPWSNKAEVLLKLGKYSEALDCSDRSLSIDSSNAFAWMMKGKAKAALGKNIEALECFDKAIELDQQNAEALNSKAIVLEKLNRIAEANTAYAKAKELGYEA